MDGDGLVLESRHIRLEPLGTKHVEPLARASACDHSLYRWSPVPRGTEEASAYVERALSWQEQGTALPFATIRLSDGVLIGSTRFFNIEKWLWPAGHPRHGRSAPDACEIGYTWFTESAIRTAANTEAKLIMLTHAFEIWNVLRVCFHTDIRNERSRAALERIGGVFEGILRSHRLAADNTARDSARYSILNSEWPVRKEGLLRRLSASAA